MSLHNRSTFLNAPGPYYNGSYTMPITATSVNPTKGAAIVVDSAQYCFFPNSKLMIIKYNYHQTTGGTAGTGDYLFGLPPGFTVDTTKIPGLVANSVVGSVIGSTLVTSGGSIGIGVARLNNTTTFKLMVVDSGTLNATFINSTFFQLSVAAVSYSFTVEVPILLDA